MGSLPVRRVSALVLGAAFVLLWCTGYPAAKLALGHGAPFTLLGVRFLIAGLLYTGIATASGAAWPRGRAALHSAMIGSLTLALQFGALYFAVTHGVNVGVVALIVGTMPIVTALLGLALGERLRPLQWLGFAFGFAGVALAVGESLGSAHGASPLAYLAVLAGLLGLSFGTLYQKHLGSGVDMRSGLAVQNLAAALLMLPLAAHEGFRLDGSAALAVSLGWLIAANSLGGFALFFVLLKRGAVNQVAALFFLMPPITALMDYFVLKDALTADKLAGIVVAAFGVYLATRPARIAAHAPGAAGARFSAPPAAAPRSVPAPCK